MHIAGYGASGDWYVNSGEQISDHSDYPIREFSDNDFLWADEITVRITDDNGHDHYYTLHGPWEDWDGFYAEVEDLWEDYGGEAA